jgi:hypothetical protein
LDKDVYSKTMAHFIEISSNCKNLEFSLDVTDKSRFILQKWEEFIAPADVISYHQPTGEDPSICGLNGGDISEGDCEAVQSMYGESDNGAGGQYSGGCEFTSTLDDHSEGEHASTGGQDYLHQSEVDSKFTNDTHKVLAKRKKDPPGSAFVKKLRVRLENDRDYLPSESDSDSNAETDISDVSDEADNLDDNSENEIAASASAEGTATA